MLNVEFMFSEESTRIYITRLKFLGGHISFELLEEKYSMNGETIFVPTLAMKNKLM